MKKETEGGRRGRRPHESAASKRGQKPARGWWQWGLRRVCTGKRGLRPVLEDDSLLELLRSQHSGRRARACLNSLLFTVQGSVAHALSRLCLQ